MARLRCRRRVVAAACSSVAPRCAARIALQRSRLAHHVAARARRSPVGTLKYTLPAEKHSHEHSHAQPWELVRCLFLRPSGGRSAVMGEPWGHLGLGGLAEWSPPADEASKRGALLHAQTHHTPLQPPLHAAPAGLCWTDDTVADAILRDPRAALAGPQGAAFSFSAVHEPALLTALLEPPRQRCAPCAHFPAPRRVALPTRRGGGPTTA